MTAPVPYQFGISEFTTWPWSFEQDVATYAELGVHVIEVCEFKLDDQRIGDQLALIGQHGLEISSVQPKIRTLFPSQSQPEPKDVHERIVAFQGTIERFGQLAAGVPFVGNTGIPPNGNIQQVLDVAAREYQALADVAGEHGARVALEPLSAATMNVESAVWTLAQAMEIVTAVDRDNFGICLDYWNIWQNADIAEEIMACGDRIFIVQLSDWRTPRSFMDRYIVGQGEIPLPPLIRATHEGGYRGPYVVEIFSRDVPDSLWDSDLSQVIKENQAGFQEAWTQAFAT